ncbi:uncharacterized protein LOC129776635 [Toxorhynchites rutilus septentrionalis]|uniref:uncharacterized protein LOC129776635 n=1 Tax=Toxorhynchites rutilus septentrionalis TaxID=329112 RepID=UPI0024786E5A|nr:uncharacterized protein LOC129776635 [Toxorhynchites rutilus septentrionalis]
MQKLYQNCEYFELGKVHTMEGHKLKLFWVILFSIIFMKATALRCFRCNSFDSPECLNIKSFTHPKNQNEPVQNLSSSIYQLQECGPDEKGREPFCRKYSINVLLNDHKRVVRDCGYERSKSDCYMADNDDHLETVCQCWTDGCNGSATMHLKHAVLYTVIVLKLWII